MSCHGFRNFEKDISSRSGGTEPKACLGEFWRVFPQGLSRTKIALESVVSGIAAHLNFRPAGSRQGEIPDPERS
jgi:hypothetical protein